MARRFSRHRPRKPVELLLVPMIDIFTVLVTFLLMTAVFSRLAILELDLPSSASGGSSAPEFRLEVIVRQKGLELSNGTQLFAAIPKRDGAHDLATLAEYALSLKRDHPDAIYASVLLEPDTAYDDLIQVMDSIRSAESPAAEGAAPSASGPAREKGPRPRPERVALFTEIAVGDAP